MTEFFKESKYSLTFVSSYLHDKEYSPHNDEWHVDRLAELVSIGIPLYLFVSPENADEIAFLQGADNLHIEVIDKTELWIFKTLSGKEYSLPEHRNVEKDTNDHLAISHSKLELINRAITHNPWNTGHFAYIDFNITYLFHEKHKTYKYIHQFSKRSFLDKILIFPGCSTPVYIENVGGLANSICWRFCGGFFAGDSESLQTWWNSYKDHFSEYLDVYQKLTWDVNLWAWIETVKRWQPRWYSANHNDSIITAISADFITKSMLPVSKRVKHNFPVISQFRPSSSSYIKTNDGVRWLNTRYVNYWLYNNGCYGYPTSSHIIKNKNMVCQLDDQFVPITGSFHLVEEQMDIPKYSGEVFSEGLEDVRLYFGKDDHIRFIATNVDYSPNGKNNMVIGDYIEKDHLIKNVKCIGPPNESWCEKNWIPIRNEAEDELFIYKWCPLEIGKTNGESGNLEIIIHHPLSAPYFDKVRGSTTFVNRHNGLLGVVHFSEDHNPRHYYHILVLLEKETCKPLKYSNCFCFKGLGVEFCIGFSDEMENEYVFWTSQMDREPMTVFIPKMEIPLCFDF